MPLTAIRIIHWDQTSAAAAEGEFARAIERGEPVVAPTESVYGVVADPASAAAVSLLGQLRQGGDLPAPALLVTDPVAARELLPEHRLGRRVAERFLPGPVTVRIDRPPPGSAWLSLPEPGRGLLLDDPSGPGLRAPASPLIARLCRMLSGPLLWQPLPAGPPETVATWLESRLAAADAVGLPEESEVQPSADPGAPASDAAGINPNPASPRRLLMISAGPTRYGKEDAVIRLHPGGLEILAEGLLGAGRIRRLAGEVILFVCTGNTCRSPMAEAICRKLLADELGCEPHELPDRGWSILSAGVSAVDGWPPSEGAVQAVREFGATLDEHYSTALSEELVRLADRILCMTADHEATVRRRWPHSAAKTARLAGRVDIPDPFGQAQREYDECARSIAESLRKLLAGLKQ